MTRIRRPGQAYVQPLQANGTKLVNENGRGSYALAANTTYFYPLGGIDHLIESAQVQWDNATILTIAIEDSNFDHNEVPDDSELPGDWLKEDPSTAYVSTTSPDGTTGGAMVTNATIAVAGGTAGGAMYHLGNTGARRTRIRIDVGATGGVVRVGANGKD